MNITRLAIEETITDPRVYCLKSPSSPTSPAIKKFNFIMGDFPMQMRDTLSPEDLEKIKKVCREKGLRYRIKEEVEKEFPTRLLTILDVLQENEIPKTAKLRKRGILEVWFSREGTSPKTYQLEREFEKRLDEADKRVKKEIDAVIASQGKNLQNGEEVYIGHDKYYHLGSLNRNIPYVQSLGFDATVGPRSSGDENNSKVLFSLCIKKTFI